MTDEKFVYVSDIIDKKRIGKSAFNKRSHTGKGGSVKLPSDFMSRKELKAMNGECKTYKINSPMSYAEFKALPKDLQISYIKQLRKAYGAPDSAIAKMLGTSQNSFCNKVKTLGLNRGKNQPKLPWDKESWFAWVQGISVSVAQKTELVAEEELHDTEEQGRTEPDTNCDAKLPVTYEKEAGSVPCSGALTFNGNATDALQTVMQLLGSGNFQIHISWSQRNA